MRNKSLRFHVVVFLFFLPFANYSQTNENIQEQLTFKYLHTDNGLSNNRIRSIEQDKYGYIWIGTAKGISRFNGLKIDKYLEYINDSSISYLTDVSCILCDSKNNIWITGGVGVCKFNWDENIFYKFSHEDTINREEDTYIGIDEDSKGNIWFAATNSLQKFDVENNKIEIFAQNSNNDNAAIPEGLIRILFIDSRDNVWMGYRAGGAAACYLDQKNGKIHEFNRGNPEDMLTQAQVEKIYEDKNGDIWIGHFNSGISVYSFSTKKFKKFIPDSNDTKSWRVRGFAEDRLGNFWIGTRAGLYKFKRRDNTFSKYAHTEHPISILSHNSIVQMMIDNQDDLWLGTYSGGVSYTNLNRSGITKYTSSKTQSEYFLFDDNVYALAFDRNDNIWVAPEYGGLNYLDKETGKFKLFKVITANGDDPVNNNIKDIIVNNENNLWFGTFDGGLFYFDTKNELFKSYLRSEDNPDGLDETTIYSLYFDILDPDMLWVGSTNGLYLMDIENEEFTRTGPNLQDRFNVPDISGRIWTIYGDDENMYFGSSQLSILSRKSNEFKSYQEINGIQINHVNFIISDRKGIVWFGLNSIYIVRFDITNSKFRIYGPEQGLPVFEYQEAEDDRLDNIWVSSNNGLIKLENIIADPDSFKVLTYDLSDNLQSLTFNFHSKAVSRSGEIAFGGQKGFNSFRPENVKLNSHKPTAIITKLTIANKEVGVHEKIFGKEILTESLLTTNTLRFHHKIKTFMLHFNAPHYVNPEKNEFAYMLEGFDNEWIYTTANASFAVYSNLKKGNYTFKVKASNNDGVWADTPTIMKIKVIPPFWNTLVFYIFVVISIVIVIWIFIQRREKMLKRDKEILEEKLQKGEEQINRQRKDVERQSEELRKRDEAERDQKWHNKGMIQIGKVMTEGENNLKKLVQAFLVELLHYLDCIQGAIVLLNNEDPNDEFLELVYGYAISKDKLKKRRIEIGESLLGACFRDGKTMFITNVPKDYCKISSGLGYTEAKSLLLVPLKHSDSILGVLELSSIKLLEKREIKFAETICETFSSNLFTTKANQKMNEFLENSKQQAEEMKSQEEEMKQNLEEMQAMQEEASRKENKLMEENEKLKKEIQNLKKHRS